jgi:hypothetical protein
MIFPKTVSITLERIIARGKFSLLEQTVNKILRMSGNGNRLVILFIIERDHQVVVGRVIIIIT